MDEAFWSSVLKRWSDASENVINLKEELAKLKEERALHICFGARDFSHNAYPSDCTSNGNVEPKVAQQSIHVDITTAQDELQDAEVGLGRAKEEYRKLQHELASSTKMIAELRLQNQRLAEEYKQEIARLCEERDVNDTPKPHFIKVQMRGEFAELGTYNGSSTVDGHAVVIDLNQQVASLEKSLEVSKAEQHEVHHELILTREKLHKAEQNIGTLLTSIVKLQAIARHPVYGSPQHTEKSLHSDSRKSSKISFISSRSHIEQVTQTGQSLKPSSLQYVGLPATISFQADVKSFLKSESPLKTVLPSSRQKALSQLPTIADLPPINSTDNIFDRPFLKYILGDGIQSLIKHFPVGCGGIDKKALMSSYLCPTLDHHPWCPSALGQHGFIFVSLEKDKDKASSQSPVTRNVFVGLPKIHSKQRVFRYLGTYRVTQVDELTSHEWNALSKKIKFMYANLITAKGQDSRSADDIMSAYDTGQSHIPCVQLQYIGFDEQFFRALVTSKKSV